MSTKLCERCKRRIKAEAVSCICGWSLAASRPVMPERLPDPLPSWEESRAAFMKHRDKFALALKPKVWDREAFIEHYEKILANPDAAHFAKQHATEALRNLGHRKGEKRAAPKERVPGEDDDLPLGIGLDDLERQFADAIEP